MHPTRLCKRTITQGMKFVYSPPSQYRYSCQRIRSIYANSQLPLLTNNVISAVCLWNLAHPSCGMSCESFARPGAISLVCYNRLLIWYMSRSTALISAIIKTTYSVARQFTKVPPWIPDTGRREGDPGKDNSAEGLYKIYSYNCIKILHIIINNSPSVLQWLVWLSHIVML